MSTTYRVNDEAVAHARRLIDQGRYDWDTPWSDAAPSTDEENALIEDEGYDGYGRWHLGIDQGASEETKGRFAFPYGDFDKVVRSALVHLVEVAVGEAAGLAERPRGRAQGVRRPPPAPRGEARGLIAGSGRHAPAG